jgi:hypothetical protein
MALSHLRQRKAFHLNISRPVKDFAVKEGRKERTERKKGRAKIFSSLA